LSTYFPNLTGLRTSTLQLKPGLTLDGVKTVF